MRNRAQRNNNPVNLRYAHQTEAVGKDADGFAVFGTPEAGWRAAHAQIRLDQTRGVSVREFIFKFAPPNENDTNAYLEFVLDELGIGSSTPLYSIGVYELAGVMAQYEGYYAKEKVVV
ncbi:hypothetical protein [Candidatus Magnetobacterium casense]|uniref:Uncharacterized protein n=1 Tax=Candidatus Magnetobacterium casense TaxID=1455061 RepID=A0ABS6S2G1_9BACT|nr:hypothetical protein [Candidatus Magnetobacterium casensis]MBV6342775.1 hypothetical protein [Candidatus Magnetobacterium casensis]